MQIYKSLSITIDKLIKIIYNKYMKGKGKNMNKRELKKQYIKGLEELQNVLAKEKEKAIRQNNNELENYIHNLLEQVIMTTLDEKIEYFE